MKGFLVFKGNMTVTTILDKPQIIKYRDYAIYYSQLEKFENDKLFYEDTEKIVLLDGVIFNKSELQGKYNNQNWKEVFETIYNKNPQSFMNDLRGSFCGVILNKKTEEILAFTNQSGEKTVYYTNMENSIIISNHNNIITNILNQINIKYTPDIQASYELLTTGSILHGKTPFENIFRLTAGKYLIYTNGKCQENRYHMFHNIPEHNLSLDECIEKLDILFRQAIKRIYSKNDEYGYQAECDLSGGLDSRMATWVANDMGFKNILNVCYCQSGNIDNTTSKKIAKDLGNKYSFLPMDGGEILLDVDEVVDKFGGQVTYDICTGANRAFKQIDTSNIGLSVTGLLGELQNAYWTEGYEHTPPKYVNNRYSDLLTLNVPAEYSNDYDNYEQMNLYEYSNLVYLSSSFVRQQICEVTSPYIDVDLLDFAYKIPLKFRKDYLLDMSWITKKYPLAAKYVWQTKNKPIDKAYNNQFYLPKFADDIAIFFKRTINKISRIFKISYQITLKTDMNPYDLWYRTNSKLPTFFNEYLRQNISLITDSNLKADVIKMFKNGTARDKILVINLLGVYKRYFNGEN